PARLSQPLGVHGHTSAARCTAHRCESRPDHHPVGLTGHPAVAPEADSDGRRDLLAEVRPARPRTDARARARDDAGAVAGVMRSGRYLPCWRRWLPCLRASVSCGWIQLEPGGEIEVDPPAGDKSRDPTTGCITFRP